MGVGLLWCVGLSVVSVGGSAAVAPVAPVAAVVGVECVPVGGVVPGSCEVVLEPTSLPQRKVVGEFELGVLSRVGAGGGVGGGGAPVSGVGELSAGGLVGSCDPATEVCSLGDAVDLGDAAAGGSGVPVRVPDGGFGSVGGDAAVAAADLDGDGRQELVRASGCRESAAASLDLCLSYFTPGAAPGDPGYSEEFGTGLSVDASGVGRVRVAAGPLGLASARVTSAEFGVDAAQESTVATFTTAGRHGFAVGEPVRLGNDAGLQAALCVESPLSQEGVQCIGQDLLSYHPVTAVTATSFSVDLGVLVVARAGVGRVVTPRPWSAGCVSCGVRAEAVSTGVAVAWTAPTGSLRLAVFSVVSGEVGSGPGFELVDVRTVGRLFTDTTTGVPARE